MINKSQIRWETRENRWCRRCAQTQEGAQHLEVPFYTTESSRHLNLVGRMHDRPPPEEPHPKKNILNIDCGLAMLGEAHIATKAVARCHVDGSILQWLEESRSSGGSWGELKVQKGLEVRNRQTGTGPNGQRRRIVEATPRGGLVQQGLDGQGRTWKRWPLGGAGEPTAARSYTPSWHEWGGRNLGRPWIQDAARVGIFCVPFVRGERREPAWRAGVRGDEEGRSCRLLPASS